MKLFRPSGGLRYHMRGTTSRRLWRDFTDSVAIWLGEWKPPTECLILIGASGGYTLQTEWLKTFKEVVIYDVDPLAETFFRRRHRGVYTQFHQQDLFWNEGKLSTAPLQRALEEDPGACVLFSNVLGQLPLEGAIDDAVFQTFLREMRTQLIARTWASYHDLYSVSPLPYALHQPLTHAFRETRDLRRALEILGGKLGRVEVLDHMLMGDWSAGLPLEVFSWSLTRRCLHIIGGVRSV